MKLTRRNGDYAIKMDTLEFIDLRSTLNVLAKDNGMDDSHFGSGYMLAINFYRPLFEELTKCLNQEPSK